MTDRYEKIHEALEMEPTPLSPPARTFGPFSRFAVRPHFVSRPDSLWREQIGWTLWDADLGEPRRVGKVYEFLEDAYEAAARRIGPQDGGAEAVAATLRGERYLPAA